MSSNITQSIQLGSKAKSAYNKDAIINLSSFADMSDEFSLVISFISDTLPLKIEQQFEGTCLRIQKGDRYYVFVSRQGRLGVIDSREKVILRDEIVADNQIWTLALSPDEKFIYCAGKDPIIKKYALDTLHIENEYPGHRSEVNSIEVSLSNDWMISCSHDNTVRLWGFNSEKIPNKILYQHSNIVLSMDLSDNNIFIASGSKDKTVIIYQLEWDHTGENGQVIKTLQCNNEVWAVKISSNNKYVVTGDQIGNILIWETISWNIINEVKEVGKIRSIDISKDETLIVTGGVDKKVIIWHLDKQRKPYIFEGHKNTIKSVLFTHDQQFIVSLGHDKSVIRWKIPFFEEKQTLEMKGSDVIRMWGVGDLVLGLTENKILTWSLQGSLISTLPISLYNFYYTTPDNTLYLLTIESEKNSKFTSKIQEYSLNQLHLKSEWKITTGKVSSMTISNSKKYLCIGELYKISTFFIKEELVLLNSQIYHDDTIIKMAITINDLYLFSIGENFEIKMLDITKMDNSSLRNSVCSIMDYTTKTDIVDIFCCNDALKVLIIAPDELMVWSLLSKTPIKKITLEKPVCRLVSSKVFEYFFLQTQESIDFWGFKDFNFITRMSVPRLETFAFVNNERNIVIKNEANVEISESPLFCKNLKIVGEDVQRNLKKFCAYVKKIVADKSIKYKDDYKNWTIMPFMFNIQHIYAYYNYDDYLREAFIPKYSKEDPEVLISKGNAPYVLSANKHTPLRVSINQEFPESATIILKALRKRWAKDPYSLIYLSDNLTTLNNFGLDGLQKLYNFALRKSFLSNLPHFCKDIALPIVFHSTTIETNSGAMLGPDADTSDGTAMIFEQTCFKLNLHLGSKESIEFMESVVNCKNEKIFETPLMQLILQEKWKKARFVMYGQSLLYAAHMGTLAYYSTLELNNSEFIIIPAVINGALLMYEIYQMFAGGLDYFKDFWNYIDLFRSFLFFVFAILIWTEHFDNNTNFLAFIILITWMRGVTYFRIFSPTRYLINLLFEVLTDIPAFLVIFFYTITAFSFIFYSLLEDNRDQNFYVTFVDTYSTTLGNTSTEGYSQLEWLFYVLITLFNFIIMLNLLISILSDTYNRVKEQEIIADGQELASMILEVELMLFWRSDMNEKEYIHLCRDQSAEEASEEKFVMTKLKSMTIKCFDYEKAAINSLTTIQNMKNDIKSQNEQLSTMINKIKAKYKIK